MNKLLLTLTLVAFSSGVLCNVVPNLTDTVNSSLEQVKAVSRSESGPIVDSVLGGFKLLGGHKEFHNGENTGCMSYVPSGYVATPGIGVHKLHERKMKWNQARKSCMDEGGQLAILNSDEEAAILLNWMKRKNLEVTWLGVHDQFEEGDWVTLKGETLKAAGYDKWNTRWPNQPDNDGGNENCGVLVKHPKNMQSAGLGDVPCNYDWHYFCEINLCCPWTVILDGVCPG